MAAKKKSPAKKKPTAKKPTKVAFGGNGFTPKKKSKKKSG